MTRVGYRLSAPTHPLCILRKWRRGVPEKSSDETANNRTIATRSFVAGIRIDSPDLKHQRRQLPCKRTELVKSH